MIDWTIKLCPKLFFDILKLQVDLLIFKKVICRLEIQIGNKLHWKQSETKKGLWKQYLRLETRILDWKHKNQIGNKIIYINIGNNLFRLETFTDMQGHNTMRSKLLKRVYVPNRSPSISI